MRLRTHAARDQHSEAHSGEQYSGLQMGAPRMVRLRPRRQNRPVVSRCSKGCATGRLPARARAHLSENRYKTKGDNDYVVITLDKPIGLDSGWLGFKLLNDSEFLQDDLVLRNGGYPILYSYTGGQLYGTRILVTKFSQITLWMIEELINAY